WDFPDRYHLYDSQESLHGTTKHRMFTPPVSKPKNNVFFSSDDNLYKTEMRKLTIPQINIECASSPPIFKLEVTDFSEPTPKSMTLKSQNLPLVKQQNIDEDNDEPRELHKKQWKNKSNDFLQGKSTSLDIPDISIDNCDDIGDREKFLNVGNRRLSQCKFSSSLQELSSSTSSINSGIHESTLDLTQIDPNTPIKHWKSPDDLREGNVKSLTQHFERVFNNKRNKLGSFSVPELNKCSCETRRFRSLSEESLDINSRLTEYERMEVLKVLCDWSLQGCEARSDANFSLKIIKEFRNLEEKGTEKVVNSNLRKCCVKFRSEPNLSPKAKTKATITENHIMKCTSEDNLGSKTLTDSDFLHECRFTNCIFNKNFDPLKGTNNLENRLIERKQLKGILKSSSEHLNKVDCINNNMVAPNKPHFLDRKSRRHSDITIPKPFNSQLVRCGSLERLTYPQRKYKTRIYSVNDVKKFPESYIVTKHNSNGQIKNNINKSSKVVVVRKKCIPKTWKSCSDIKSRQKTIKKCCRNAKRTCPMLRGSPQVKRKTQSCAEINQESLDFAARVAALKDIQLSNFD
ncbi:hypothetical protein ILUMI_05929, partial [Ignelater luminosus]